MDHYLLERRPSVLPAFQAPRFNCCPGLACGHGRHSKIVAERSGQLTLMDVHEENIEHCRTRLARFQNTVFFKNSGHDFQPITDDALTAIFCYDAMVHFSPDLVQAYLRDTARVLKPGGGLSITTPIIPRHWIGTT